MSAGKPAADAAATTIDALLASMKRRRLLWELHLATTTTDPTGSLSNAVLDGDTVSVPVQSMLGQVPSGQRVVVVYVPPAGYYVVGWVGNPPTDPREAFGTVGVAAGGGVPVTQAVVYSALVGTGNTYAWATPNTSAPGTAVTGVSVTGSVTSTGLTVAVTRTGGTVTTNVYWLAKRVQ